MAVGWKFSAPEPDAARRARTQFVKYLRSVCTAGSDIDAAEIVYGELVGNVVRHARGPIDVGFEWAGARAILRVRDSGDGFEKHVALPAGMSESGRGLFIVQQLALDVDVSCDRAGCEVRATLPLRRSGG